jgi:hypothetical protein
MSNITKGGISTTEKILGPDDKEYTPRDFLPVQTKHKRKLSDSEKSKMKKAAEARKQQLLMERESGAGYSGTEDYKQ